MVRAVDSLAPARSPFGLPVHVADSRHLHSPDRPRAIEVNRPYLTIPSRRPKCFPANSS